MTHEPSQEGRISRMEQIAKQLADISNDHEKRIRSVELRLAYGVGVIGAIGFLLKVLKVI